MTTYQIKRSLLGLHCNAWVDVTSGGALRIGCSTKVRHDPTELIRQSERDGKPIVVVTFNYRVGIFGEYQFLNTEARITIDTCLLVCRMVKSS